MLRPSPPILFDQSRLTGLCFCLFFSAKNLRYALARLVIERFEKSWVVKIGNPLCFFEFVSHLFSFLVFILERLYGIRREGPREGEGPGDAYIGSFDRNVSNGRWVCTLTVSCHGGRAPVSGHESVQAMAKTGLVGRNLKFILCCIVLCLQSFLNYGLHTLRIGVQYVPGQ